MSRSSPSRVLGAAVAAAVPAALADVLPFSCSCASAAVTTPIPSASTTTADLTRPCDLISALLGWSSTPAKTPGVDASEARSLVARANERSLAAKLVEALELAAVDGREFLGSLPVAEGHDRRHAPVV